MENSVGLKIKSIMMEYHWLFIMRYRKTGNRLLDSGEPLTSKKLIRLSNLITSHGISAIQLQTEYETTVGLRS